MSEGKLGELVYVGHVLGALGKADDVAMRHLLAVALLDGTDRAERIEHFARHGRKVAVAAVLAQIGQRARMHERMLAELHLDHMEAEGLYLPDQRLHRTVRCAGRAGIGKRALHDAQIGQEIVGRAIHGVCIATHRGVKAVGHDEHHGAMRLGRADSVGTAREHLAHLDLMVPEIEQLVGRLGVACLEREVAPHAAALLGKLLNHMRSELSCYLPRYLSGDVGIAVAIRADPATGMEERRAHRRHRAGILAQNPVVETTIYLGNGIEERVVEDIDDGIGFLDGRRLLHRDGARAHESVDLLQEMPLVFHESRAAKARMLAQQLRNATDLAFDGLAARLGGVRGKDRMKLKLGQELRRRTAPHLAHELVVGHRELIRRIDGRVDGNLTLALKERLHAVVLFGEIRQMEERRKRAHHHLLLVDIKAVEHGHRITERAGALGVRSGHALPVGGLGRRHAARIALVGAGHVVEQLIKGVAKLRTVVAEHLPLQAHEKRQVIAQALGQLDFSVASDHEVGVGSAELMLRHLAA